MKTKYANEPQYQYGIALGTQNPGSMIMHSLYLPYVYLRTNRDMNLIPITTLINTTNTTTT